MDKLIKMQKIINGLLDENGDNLKDNEGKPAFDYKDGDAVKFYDKENGSAGTRLRKAMNEMKALAQEVRKEVQEIKNAFKGNS